MRCYQDYADFNRTYNKKARETEKKIAEKFNKSDIIKEIAVKSQFGKRRDEFALGTFVENFEKLKLSEGIETVITDETTGLKIIYDGENVIKRSDGCVFEKGKDDEESTLFTVQLDEEEEEIFNSYLNKSTGVKSELNIQACMSEIFDYYKAGPSVSGTIEGVTLNGIIDGIVKEPGKPDVLIEIKKRVNKIFSLEELAERKYDLCQIVLYKHLYWNSLQAKLKDSNSNLDYNPTKILIVQTFENDLSIERIDTKLQRQILKDFIDGITKFKNEIFFKY